MPDRTRPSSRAPVAPHTVLAFDFGLRRIGIAAGETLTATASPRPAVAMLSGGPDWLAIERTVREIAPRLLVVGIPYNADGRAGALTDAARGFGAALRERFHLEVQF